MSLESSAVNQHKTPAEQDHFQDEIQPFSLSDDEKDQPVGHGIESERKVEDDESEEVRVSRPSSTWSRPQSKPNLVERLENEADLDEFEREEREILQKLEEESHQKPNDDDLEVIGLDEDFNRQESDHQLEPQPLEVIDEEQEPKSESIKGSTREEDFIEVPDSVQNRQLSADIRQQDSVEATYSDESDYPGGYPVQSINAPPPAYSSNPTQDQPIQRKQVQIFEDLPKNDDILSGSSSRKTSEGVGSVVAQAGGIATALAKTVTSTGIVRSNQSNISTDTKMTDIGSHSSDELEDFDIPNQAVQQEHHTQNTLGSPNYRLSSDIKELAHYVEEFTAERIEIQAMLRPFFLDYIPAVGDVDAFLKIPRPDQIDDQLGLVVLDEPAAAQSDSTIVDMKLRQLSNAVSKPEDAPVKKLDRADKNQQQIENWIKNIKELRRSRPPDRVAYSRQMPDLEKLMQEWPTEIDKQFQNFTLPTAKLDCSLEEYADLCLSLVDIPVHKNRIHALHLLFSLYAEFKNSQHFRNLASNNGNSNFLYGDAPKTAERLEL